MKSEESMRRFLFKTQENEVHMVESSISPMQANFKFAMHQRF